MKLPKGAAYAAFATGVLASGVGRLCTLALPIRASDSKALDEPQGQWRLVLVGCQVILLKTIERPWPQKPGKTGHRPATLPVKANFWTGSPWRGKRKALLERG
jgi:hypothetical protein